MLIEVKKQVSETVEFKTPCYFKENFGGYCYINDIGDLIKVHNSSIILWDQSDSEYYREAVQRATKDCAFVTKEEFEKEYIKTVAKLNIVAGAVEINS